MQVRNITITTHKRWFIPNGDTKYEPKLRCHQDESGRPFSVKAHPFKAQVWNSSAVPCHPYRTLMFPYRILLNARVPARARQTPSGREKDAKTRDLMNMTMGTLSFQKSQVWERRTKHIGKSRAFLCEKSTPSISNDDTECVLLRNKETRCILYHWGISDVSLCSESTYLLASSELLNSR